MSDTIRTAILTELERRGITIYEFSIIMEKNGVSQSVTYKFLKQGKQCQTDKAGLMLDELELTFKI